MALPAQEYTLIGVCDGEIPQTVNNSSSCYTNKVGGLPELLPGISLPCLRCDRCGAPLTHVVQVYCPLDHQHHRALHVFACPSAECLGGGKGWRALRSQCPQAAPEKRDVSRPTPPQETPLSATDWCDTADDWGMEDEEGDGWGEDAEKKKQVEEKQMEEEKEEPAGAAHVKDDSSLSTKLQDLILEESHSDDKVPLLRSFYISVLEETDLCGDSELEHAQQLLRDYEEREGVVVEELVGGEGGEEKYEKSNAPHGDDVFSSFMCRISPCPQQILRYQWGGEPLFIAKPPPNMAQVVPPCGSCGGSRTFELQLMPALVSLLQRVDSQTEQQLEFGTVLVYTCNNSCWPAGQGSVLEEFCFVQDDPDQELFKIPGRA